MSPSVSHLGRATVRLSVRVPLLDTLATMAAVLVVAAPLIFTQSSFSPDFPNHLWLTWAAGKALVQNGHPSYFLNTDKLGVFYPFFAFYGGTLYTFTGGLGEMLGGHPVLAFVIVTLLALTGTYGGMLWLGRQLGLRGWTAHAPALTVLTSAYYVTNLYGRSAWPELIATSAIAPLLASGLHLVRSPAWRPLPIAIFVGSAMALTGSHNITFMWATTVGALASPLLWLALGRGRRLPYRRLGMVCCLGAASVMVNAWFLFPDLAFESRVSISHQSSVIWAASSFFNTPANVFNPLRHVPTQSTTPALFVQAPDWFLVWGVVAGVLLLLRDRAAGALRRAWLGAIVLVALTMALVMFEPLWEVVPPPFDDIQFTYRLGSYLFYAVAGLVLVGALALEWAHASGRRHTSARRLRAALIAVSLISVALCVWQIWAPNVEVPGAYANRGEALASINSFPRTWYDGGSFRDVSGTRVGYSFERTLLIEPSAVHGERYAAEMNLPPGPGPILTNIMAGSYLIRIAGGVEKVGDAYYGEAVVKRVAGGSGPVKVVIEATRGTVVTFGWIASIVALLAILAVLIGSGVRRAREPA